MRDSWKRVEVGDSSISQDTTGSSVGSFYNLIIISTYNHKYPRIVQTKKTDCTYSIDKGKQTKIVFIIAISSVYLYALVLSFGTLFFQTLRSE